MKVHDVLERRLQRSIAGSNGGTLSKDFAIIALTFVIYFWDLLGIAYNSLYTTRTVKRAFSVEVSIFPLAFPLLYKGARKMRQIPDEMLHWQNLLFLAKKHFFLQHLLLQYLLLQMPELSLQSCFYRHCKPLWHFPSPLTLFIVLHPFYKPWDVGF